jgi:ATP-dependent DNA helicase RecQ
MVIDILRGSKNKRILTLGLDSLSTYDIMADVPLQRAHHIIDSLVSAGYLQTTSGEYTMLQLSSRYSELLAPDARYVIKLPKEIKREKVERPAGKSRSSAAASLSSPAEVELFEALRKLRTQLAKAAEMPAYIIFSDAALRDMAVKQPTTPEAFLEVSGVGAKKLETYGQAFIDCIIKHNS